MPHPNPSSRDLAEELLLLKETIDAFVFGPSFAQSQQPSLARGGCATATFGQDRSELLEAATRLRASMRKIINTQPVSSMHLSPSAPTPPPPSPASPSQAGQARVALSPTRRQQLPTNTAVFLNQSHSPSDSHKVRTDGAVLVPTRGDSPRGGHGVAGSPAPHSLAMSRSTETLIGIARSYGVSVTDLRAANPNFDGFEDDEFLPAHSPVRVPPSRFNGSNSDHNGAKRQSAPPASPSYTEVGGPGASATDTPQRGFTHIGGTSPQAPTPYYTNAYAAPAPYNAPVDRALEASLVAPPLLPETLSPTPMSPTAGRGRAVGSVQTPTHYAEGTVAFEQYPRSNQRRTTADSDSVWSLAKEYDLPVRDLLRANPQLRNFGVNEPLPAQMLVAIPMGL